MIVFVFVIGEPLGLGTDWYGFVSILPLCAAQS